MPGNEGQLGLVEVAVDHVEVGAAHAAGMHSQQDLALAGPWVGQLLQPERLPLAVEDHGPHASIIAQPCREDARTEAG
jgi:hypothetical protein